MAVDFGAWSISFVGKATGNQLAVQHESNKAHPKQTQAYTVTGTYVKLHIGKYACIRHPQKYVCAAERKEPLQINTPTNPDDIMKQYAH